MSKSRVMALADKLGVEVTDEGGSIVLESKAGVMFAGYFQHSLVFDFAGYDLPKSQAWQEALVDLRSGVAPCNIQSCDYCNESNEKEG